MRFLLCVKCLTRHLPCLVPSGDDRACVHVVCARVHVCVFAGLEQDVGEV